MCKILTKLLMSKWSGLRLLAVSATGSMVFTMYALKFRLAKGMNGFHDNKSFTKSVKQQYYYQKKKICIELN